MIAIISDIHGNYPALLSVLNKIDKLGISEIYCLGDIVGYYSQVNECCEELQRRNIKCILGNHDWYLISNTSCPRSKSANDCLRFHASIIKLSNLDWLRSLPILIQIDQLSMVHGGWINPLDEYLHNPCQDYFDNIASKFFASGHTHKQRVDNFGKKIYCNPGSVGQPRDRDYRAAFATFNGFTFNLFRVDYNVKLTCDHMQNSGFSNYFFNRLMLGAENFI
jgi:putative phosphoesterase